MKKISFVLSVIFLFCISTAESQIFNLLGEEEKLSIPFVYDGQFIYVRMQINNGMYLNFILDSGAENLLIIKKSIADIHQLQYTKRIPIYGSDLKVMRYAKISPMVEIDLGQEKTTFANFLVFEEDETSLDKYSGRRIDGIIGGALLSKFIVHIDFDKSMLHLYKKKADIKDMNDFVSHDIEIIRKKPYITLEVEDFNSTSEKTFLLDTGAGINALLLIKNEELAIDSAKYVYGIIGKSINGPLLGYFGKLTRVKNGLIDLKDIIVSYQSTDSLDLPEGLLKRDGIIGNHILRNYEMIIDYPHSKLYIHEDFSEEKVNSYDRSGLSLSATGKDFGDIKVDYVVSGSPADKAGIRKGDKILTFNWFPVGFYSLNSINKKLKNKEGKKIRLKVFRDGESMIKTFRLRDVL